MPAYVPIKNPWFSEASAISYLFNITLGSNGRVKSSICPGTVTGAVKT